MNRRTLLATLGGSFIGFAGCASVTDTAPTPAGNRTPTAGADTDGQPSTETPTETYTSVSVELRRVEYVVNAFQVAPGRGINPDDIVPEEEIPNGLLEALHEARDGGFETESISDALLTAIDQFRSSTTGELNPYVELAGTNYEFDPVVPIFVAELQDGSLDDYDEDRLLRADERWDLESEAVQTFVRALTADGTHVPRSQYRRSVVPDAVTEFLDEYDYLEDQQGVSRITTTDRHADPPYTITLDELTPEDMWGRPVVEETDLDDELVTFFDRVLDSKHRKPALPSPDRWQYFTDAVPNAYSDAVEEYESPPYFRLDGAVYSIAVGQPRYDRVPVSVSIEEADASDRAFTLTASPAPEKLDDEIEGPFTFTSRGALPSLLWIVHDGDRFLLNSDQDGPPDNEALETIHAGDSLSVSCTVPDDLPEGQYVSRGQFGLSWSIPDQTPGEHGLFPFELLITIEAG